MFTVFTPDSLRMQIDAHQAWIKGDSAGGRLDWRDDTIPFVDLTGVNLSRAIMSRTDLRSVVMRGADMSDSNLFGAEFDQDLSGVNFASSQLMHADLSHADLTDVIFTRTNLFAASLKGTYLNGVDFREIVSVNEAKFQGSDLSNANFHRVCIRGANFAGARLTGVDFAGARCIGVDFPKVSLEHADFHGCQFVGCTFGNARLRGADLRNAVLDDSWLSYVDLRHANTEGYRVIESRGAGVNPAGLSGLLTPA
jgi:uncharacterized protein YjbI with pentapeptide repeats